MTTHNAANNSDLEYLRAHLEKERADDPEGHVCLAYELYDALITVAEAAERVSFETSENQPGSHDWHLINDLRLKVADLITDHNEV